MKFLIYMSLIVMVYAHYYQHPPLFWEGPQFYSNNYYNNYPYGSKKYDNRYGSKYNNWYNYDNRYDNQYGGFYDEYKYKSNQYDHKYGSNQYDKHHSNQYDKYGHNQNDKNPQSYGSIEYDRNPHSFGSNQYDKYGKSQYDNNYGSKPYAFQYGSQLNMDFGTGVTDGKFEPSVYHYSWIHDGDRVYSHSGAVSYCNNLGQGWYPVAIETKGEDAFIDDVIASHRKKYIWTGGVRAGFAWRWSNGGIFRDLDWSPTGGKGKAQPDNQEGNENCLGVLNNFYGDGIRWHDIACHHTKPVICEKNSL
ncbi:Lectin C-type domain [Halocaridina rubra]|uniref:Lectin C-type domain n=1 Tax=Halocaridina rubra TaxID=373956 RepID=A0AAN8XS68_HALRR